MKAILVEEFGTAAVLKMTERPVPQLNDNQLLIEQFATSINPSDWKKRGGEWGGKLPFIPGNDAAGIIRKVGPAVTSFKPGDRVMANASAAYAEYAVARESVTGLLPETIPFTEAAGFPLAGQTAYQALVEIGKLQKGESVLIHAGAGGVGTLAIQTAKLIGAEVITTTSKENEMFLYALGADEVIDYRGKKFEEEMAPVDLVLDPIGGNVQKRSMKVLKNGGRLVTLAGLQEEVVENNKEEQRFQLYDFSMKPNAKGMIFLARYLKEGKLRTFVQEIFPFTEVAIQQAQKLSEQGHVRGKLVIEIKEETIHLLERPS